MTRAGLLRTGIIAAALGAVFYYLVAPKDRTYDDRDGEAIAVATSH